MKTVTKRGIALIAVGLAMIVGGIVFASATSDNPTVETTNHTVSPLPLDRTSTSDVALAKCVNWVTINYPSTDDKVAMCNYLATNKTEAYNTQFGRDND